MLASGIIIGGGWILCLGLGLYLVIRHRRKAWRITAGVLCLIFALLGFLLAWRVFAGWDYSPATAPGGASQAHARKVGMWTYSLHVQHRGEELVFRLPSCQECPVTERVFWIDAELLGVDLTGGPDYVLDVGDFVSAMEEGRLEDLRQRTYERPPLPSESALFDSP